MKTARKHTMEGFTRVVNRLEKQNALVIRARAIAANKIAKLAVGRSRKVAYRVKGAALSELLKMGYATLNSVELWPEVVLGLEFRHGGMLHVVPASLKPEVEGIVLQQATALWGAPPTRLPSPRAATKEPSAANNNIASATSC